MATLVRADAPPVRRSIAWDDTASDVTHLINDTHDDTARQNDASQQHEEEEDKEPLTPEDVSLAWARRTRCFEGFEGKRTSYLSTTQLTCSNVMSTIVTSRPVDTSARRKVKSSSNQHESSPPQQRTATTHVYAQSSNPKKIKKNGKYQAQLPSFQRSLPALPIPVPRLNQELLLERDKFMKQLHQEREDKRMLDNWAATKIQACYRGFRARPRVVTYETRRRLVHSSDSLRFEISDSIKRDSTTTDAGGRRASTVSASSPWRSEIQSRASKKRDFRARTDRMHAAATRIQSIVKRFLARFAFTQLLCRHYDELYLRAVIKVQGVFRGYRLRAKMCMIVAKLQLQAAVQIQSLMRGILARERVSILKFERKCEALRRTGQPLQFTLPNRANDIVHTSCLRCLYEHRKSRAHVEFRTHAWTEERLYLRIYKVTIKLNVQRQWLLRMNMVVPTTRQRKKRLTPQLVRQLSRVRSRGSSSNLGNSSSQSPATSPSGRRRMYGVSKSPASPVSSRPSSPLSGIPARVIE